MSTHQESIKRVYKWYVPVDDITLVGYDPHPTIKGKVAV